MATEETLKAELQEQGHSSKDAAEHAEALTGLTEAAPQSANRFVTEAALVLPRPDDGKEVIFMRGERLPDWAHQGSNPVEEPSKDPSASKARKSVRTLRES